MEWKQSEKGGDWMQNPSTSEGSKCVFYLNFNL